MAFIISDPIVKVTLIGDTKVGKSSVLLNHEEGSSVLYDPGRIQVTEGHRLTSTNITSGYHNLKLLIWDTSGQEVYRGLIPSWLTNAKVVVCVYDITSKESYDKIPNLLKVAKESADSRAIFFLVGNKADLMHLRKVEKSNVEDFATDNGMIFMECSSLTGLNILKLFESITKQVISVYKEMFPTFEESYEIIEFDEILKSLTMTPKQKKKKKGWFW